MQRSLKCLCEMVKPKKQQKSFDIRKHGNAPARISCPASEEAGVFSSILSSRGKKSRDFFTEDSKLYITPREAELLRKGASLDREVKKWDSLSCRVVREFKRYRPSTATILLEEFERRSQLLQESVSSASENFLGNFTLLRLWNASIVGAIIFGMITMTFVYRYLGQGASADLTPGADQQIVQQVSLSAPKVLGAETIKADDISAQTIQSSKDEEQQQLERDILAIVKGYPIESMAPYIAEQDRIVAAFIVAIARQESTWGLHQPVLDGKVCDNLWGYRGVRERMGTGGHTCFDSQQDAVATVAKRIQYLVEEEGLDTPKKMVNVWKCGGDCEATGGQAAADRWVVNVNEIFAKLK